MYFMTKLFFSTVLAALSMAAYADDMASKDSIRQLLVLSNMRATLDSVTAQFDQYMDNGFKQALQGKTPTPEQQKVMDAIRTKMAAIMREELNWDSLEPLYIDIYHETFTQSEVDGMIQFYKTPAGKSMIKKLPIVTQKSMLAVQQRMPALIAKLQQVTREAQVEMQKPADPAAKP